VHSDVYSIDSSSAEVCRGTLGHNCSLLTSFRMLSTWVRSKSLHLLTFSVRLHGHVY